MMQGSAQLTCLQLAVHPSAVSIQTRKEQSHHHLPSELPLHRLYLRASLLTDGDSLRRCSFLSQGVFFVQRAVFHFIPA